MSKLKCWNMHRSMFHVSNNTDLGNSIFSKNAPHSDQLKLGVIYILLTPYWFSIGSLWHHDLPVTTPALETDLLLRSWWSGLKIDHFPHKFRAGIWDVSSNRASLSRRLDDGRVHFGVFPEKSICCHINGHHKQHILSVSARAEARRHVEQYMIVDTL